MPLDPEYYQDPSMMTEEQLMMLQDPQMTDYAPPQVAQAPAPQAAQRPPIQFDKSGVNALQDYIQNLKDQKQAIDYTPLAAYLDSTFGGNLTAAAQATRGMSKEEKAMKLGQLQNELAQRKNDINKNEVAARNAELQAQNTQALLGLRKQGVTNQGKRVGLMEDKMASSAGAAIEKSVEPFKKVIRSLSRGEDIINGDEPVTSKTFALANQDFIDSVAQGGAAAEGKVKREIIDGIAQDINDLHLKFGDITDLREDPRAAPVVKHLLGLMAEAKQSYAGAMQQQALDAHDSYATVDSPKVQAIAKKKLMRYAPDAYENIYKEKAKKSDAVYGAAPKVKPTSDAEDMDAVKWASAPENANNPDAIAILKHHAEAK